MRLIRSPVPLLLPAEMHTASNTNKKRAPPQRIVMQRSVYHRHAHPIRSQSQHPLLAQHRSHRSHPIASSDSSQEPSSTSSSGYSGNYSDVWSDPNGAILGAKSDDNSPLSSGVSLDCTDRTTGLSGSSSQSLRSDDGPSKQTEIKAKTMLNKQNGERLETNEVTVGSGGANGGERSKGRVAVMNRNRLLVRLLNGSRKRKNNRSTANELAKAGLEEAATGKTEVEDEEEVKEDEPQTNHVDPPALPPPRVVTSNDEDHKRHRNAHRAVAPPSSLLSPLSTLPSSQPQPPRAKSVERVGAKFVSLAKFRHSKAIVTKAKAISSDCNQKNVDLTSDSNTCQIADHTEDSTCLGEQMCMCDHLN